jgi:SAM-dependent methyltransferase
MIAYARERRTARQAISHRGKEGTVDMTSIMGRAAKLLSNLRRDLRFGGIFLGGSIPSRYADRGAVETANTDYRVLELLFARVALRPDDVLVDVGCGKGRVLNFLLGLGGSQRIVGLELDPEIAAQTARRLRKYARVRILAGDARELLPADGTVFYLYHPFNDVVLRDVLPRFKAITAADRPVIIYYNPVHVDLFAADPHWRIERFDMPGFAHEAAIIRPAGGSA